jgi:hypothetical protein
VTNSIHLSPFSFIFFITTPFQDSTWQTVTFLPTTLCICPLLHGSLCQYVRPKKWNLPERLLKSCSN